MQLKNDLKPNTDYLEQLISTTHKEVSSYQKPQVKGQNSDKLNRDDQVKIAENLYSKINDKKWWQELANKRISKYSQEVKQEKESIDAFLQKYESRIKEMKKADAKYDFESLKKSLLEQNKKNREQKLYEEWTGTLKIRVASKLNETNKEKNESKTAGEALGAIIAKTKLAIGVHNHPSNLLYQVQKEYKKEHHQLENAYAAFKKDPQLLPNLQRDVKAMEQSKLWPEDKLLHELKHTKDLSKSAKIIFTTLQDHHIQETMKELKKFKTNYRQTINGQKFQGPIKYLEYKLHEDKHANAYLKDSSIEKIYKNLSTAVEKRMNQKNLELEHELTK